MKSIFLLIGLVFVQFIYGQETFEKSYFNNQTGYGGTVYEVSDGYVVAGQVSGSGQYDLLLFKVDFQGDAIWSKNNGVKGDGYTFLEKTKDGGYIFLNNYSNITTHEDIYLTKVSGTGEIIWQKNIKKNNWDYGEQIMESSNGNLIIVGRTNSLPGISSPHPYDIFIVKTNSIGDKIWSKNIGSYSINDYGVAIKETPESDYIIAGYYGTSSIDQDEQILLLKMNTDGDTLWSKSIGSDKNERVCDVEIDADNSYLITGTKYRNTSDGDVVDNVCVAKTDFNGNLIWDKSYSFETDYYGRKILILEDGYLIAGESRSVNNVFDIFLLKINKQGDKIWSKVIEGDNTYFCKSIKKCKDQGYIITGKTYDGTLFLLKTDSDGCIQPLIKEISGEQQVSIDDTITYITNAIRGMDYEWKSTFGTIVSGQSNDSVKIYWDKTGVDTISVVASNNCGTDTLDYIVKIDRCLAPVISSVTGNTNVNFSFTEEYSVQKIQGKKPIEYHWTLDLGQVLFGQNTPEIEVEWNNTGIDKIQVIATNICGSDTSFSDNIYLIYSNVPINTKDKLLIFPNPSIDGVFNIMTDENMSNIKIFNMQGELVHEVNLNKSSQLNLSGFSQGLYLLNIKQGEVTINRKVVIK